MSNFCSHILTQVNYYYSSRTITLVCVCVCAFFFHHWSPKEIIMQLLVILTMLCQAYNADLYIYYMFQRLFPPLSYSSSLNKMQLMRVQAGWLAFVVTKKSWPFASFVCIMLQAHKALAKNEPSCCLLKWQTCVYK